MSLSTLRKIALLGLALSVLSVSCVARQINVIGPTARLELEGLTFHLTLGATNTVSGESTIMSLPVLYSEGDRRSVIIGVRNEPEIVFSPYVEKATIASMEDETYVVNLHVNEEGRELFANLTEKLAANEQPNYLATLLDGKLLSAPVVLERISTSKIPIFGGFTKEQAENIAGRINQFNK